MTGAFVPFDTVRNILWAVDGCGLILATALPALYFSKKGHDIVAAGFLIFIVAESVVFLSSTGDLNKNIPVFEAGTCL